MMQKLPTGIGIWNAGLRGGEEAGAVTSIQAAEELGYTCVWMPDRGEPGLFERMELLLEATGTIKVATGILNIWMHEAQSVADNYARLNETYGDRFVLGLGASHALIVGDGTYAKPYSAMVSFLDALDAASPLVAPSERVLAALRPRMVELAATRTGGVHSYLVPAEHTRDVRKAIGPDSYLATEVGVVMESDPDKARATVRAGLGMYFHLPNYLQNLADYGFSDEDLAPPGSDRVIDALVAWGTDDAITSKIREHADAGANHVCVQVLTGEGTGEPTFPVPEWTRLAEILGLKG
jgi:probable F420-dependent oxidoreductase